MKKKIILGCLSVLIFFACKKTADNTTGNTGTSQIIAEASVPAAVLSTFNASFGTSTEREWHHGSDDRFTCQFNMNDQRHEAEFGDDGHEDAHFVICLEATVPDVVLNAFRSNFPNDVVYEWKLNSDNTWKAHFLRNSVKYEVTLNAAGDMLKSEHD